MTDSKLLLEKIDAMAQERKSAILSRPDTLTIKGSTYYVSRNGDDQNDGRTPATAWRTLEKVSAAELLPGDGVLFCRGDLFRGCVKTKPGVTYGAYGEGEKPRFYGWDYSLADPALWELYDAEHSIWKMKHKILDPGTLVFEDGELHSYKLIPSYIRGQFVCRDTDRPFDMRAEMERDLDIYWHFEDILTSTPSKGEDFPIPDMTSRSYGDLYLRCDRGNPGEVFGEIEAVPRRGMFLVGANDGVHIDNLCIKYVGIHGVTAGGRCVKGLHVTGCEFGWIGGTIQTYLGVDPNHPAGIHGEVTRFGNAIEIYGGCDDYVVTDCYIYQVYDAGITHQITTGGRTIEMKNVLYKDNLVEKCVYSIEYFLDMNNGDVDSAMDGIEMCGNILREAGYGWGQQRHNKHTPAHIKGWSYVNRAKNYSVHDNIFDRSAYRLVHLVAKEDASCPAMARNVYVQHKGGMLGQYGGNEVAEPPIHLFDENVESRIRDVFGESDAVVAVLES